MVAATAGAWKSILVFISSTFKDMQAERDFLVRFVFPRLREKLLPWHIHLVEIDLRWGITSEQDVSSACLEFIDECRPRFIALLGDRYGSYAPGQSRSITEEEIRYGVLDSLQEEGRAHAFFYLRDPKATDGIGQGELSLYCESLGSREHELLTRLKADIQAAGLNCRSYHAQWDAQRHRFVGLQELGTRVLDDLMGSITRGLGSAPAEPPDVFAEERAAMADFVQERTQHYVDGQHTRVLHRMHEFVRARDEPHLLAVTGFAGSGKSALLSRFYRQCTEGPAAPGSLRLDPAGNFVITHFVGATARSNDMRFTLRRLCHELQRALGDTQPLNTEGEALVRSYTNLLAKAAHTRQVILLLDELDRFGPARQARTLDLLPRQVPAQVRIIFSERLGAPLEPQLSPSSGEVPELDSVVGLLGARDLRFTRLTLEPLPPEDARELIDETLLPYHKHLEVDDVGALLVKAGSRNPLYLKVALEELRTLATHDDIHQRITRLPEEVRPLFRWLLEERLASDPGFEDEHGALVGRRLVHDFMSYLGVSRHGLSHRVLVALVEPGDRQGNIAALERLLRPYLMQRGELLDFYHEQLRDAVTETFLSREEVRLDFHQRLARHFLSRWASEENALSELPYHLCEARKWELLLSVLTDTALLGARLERLGVEAVIEDYRRAYRALHPASRELAERLVRELVQLLALHEESGPPGLQLSSWHAFLTYRQEPEPSLYTRLLEVAAAGGELPAAFVAHCQLRLGILLRRKQSLARGEALLQQALSRLPADALELRALAEYERGYLLFLRGEDPNAAADHLGQSAEYSRTLHDTVHENICRCIQARVRFLFGMSSALEYRKVLEQARDAFQWMSAGSSPPPDAERWVVNTTVHLFEAALAEGRQEQAGVELNRLSDFNWVSDTGREKYLPLFRARYAMLRRDWTHALEHFQQLPRPMRNWGGKEDEVAQIHLEYGQTLAALGRWDQAREQWLAGLRCPDERGNRPWKARIREELALSAERFAAK